MDIDDITTYIQSIEDAAADMRAALSDIQSGDMPSIAEHYALETIRDYAQQIEGHALDIIDLINKNQD